MPLTSAQITKNNKKLAHSIWRFSYWRQNSSKTEQGVRDSVQIWRRSWEGTFLCTTYGTKVPWATAIFALWQPETPQANTLAAVFPTHAGQESCAGYEWQHSLKEVCLPFSLPFPSEEDMSNQRNLTAEEGTKLWSFSPWVVSKPQG